MGKASIGSLMLGTCHFVPFTGNVKSAADRPRCSVDGNVPDMTSI